MHPTDPRAPACERLVGGPSRHSVRRARGGEDLSGEVLVHAVPMTGPHLVYVQLSHDLSAGTRTMHWKPRCDVEVSIVCGMRAAGL